MKCDVGCNSEATETIIKYPAITRRVPSPGREDHLIIFFKKIFQ